MRPNLVGERIPRVNDKRLLEGGGRYLDDLEIPGTRHAALIRSPVPHGTITNFDTSEVGEGATVFGPDELLAAGPGGLPVVWVVGDQAVTHVPVVGRTVRYVGQAIGVAVAASRYEAEDAADRVIVDFDELPVVVDVETALGDDAPLLYPDAGSNILCSFEAGSPAEDVDAVFADADHTIAKTFRIGRLSGAPIEPRGVVAVPDPHGQLTVHQSTQAPHAAREGICCATGLPLSAVRVIAPDVGGGFGVKDHCEEEMLVILAAIELGVPVKWVEDRQEALLANTQARDELHEAEIAFDADGTLRAMRVRAYRNVGGHSSIFGAGPLFAMAGTLPGPYKWEALRCVGTAVLTNKATTGAYRGFGQPQSAFTRERLVDMVAAELGRDPVDLREQNMITADELPFMIPTMLMYDNGDYPAALRRAQELSEAWPDGPDDGRERGIGFSSYVQFGGIGPSAAIAMIGIKAGGFETATVHMAKDGSVQVSSGISPHGQGQETTFAQLVADQLGIGVEDVSLVVGDTEHTPLSLYGTAASRSIAVGGGAAVIASEQLAAKLRRIAAEMLEASPDDIELGGGAATVAGTNVSVPVADVAAEAWIGARLPEGDTPGLIETHAYDPVSATFSYATHVCRVAVDRGTGVTEIEKYAVVNDCGTMVNPTIVEGQIHGAIAQGVGATLLEDVVYSDDGQPQSTTFLDYLMPVSATLPDIEIEHIETPSPYTPGGMKGMGEGGTDGSFVCVANAIAAALPDIAADITDTPLSPSAVWELLN